MVRKNLSACLAGVTLMMLIAACKKEEPAPDFTGSYLALAFRNECTNAASNASINANAANELCVASTGGQTCITLTLILKGDKSYTLTSITKTTTNGVVSTKSATDVGTFTVSGTSITMCTPSNSCFTITQATGPTEFEWLASNSNGCKGIYTLRKF